MSEAVSLCSKTLGLVIESYTRAIESSPRIIGGGGVCLNYSEIIFKYSKTSD